MNRFNKIYLTVFILSFYSLINAQNEVSNFVLPSTDDESYSFEDLQGKELTVLDFWASWCKPCMKSLPKLNDLYHEYKDKGVQIIGVNNDDPRSVSKVAPIVNSLGIEYPILQDIDKVVFTELNLQSLPTLVILRGHKVVYTHEGYIAGDEKKIKEEIELLLNAK